MASVVNTKNYIDKIVKSISELTKELDKEINKIVANEIGIPDYEQVTKSKRSLYNSYSDVIVLNDEVIRLIVKAKKTSIMIKDVINCIVATDEYPITVANAQKKKLQSMDNNINEYVRILTCYRDNLDAVLRFYSSVQYIVSSPRLNMYEE